MVVVVVVVEEEEEEEEARPQFAAPGAGQLRRSCSARPTLSSPGRPGGRLDVAAAFALDVLLVVRNADVEHLCDRSGRSDLPVRAHAEEAEDHLAGC